MVHTVGMTQTFYYFEACGFVSQPFEAADIEAAEAHALATFRDPTSPDFDEDDGGILGWDAELEEWTCLVTFTGDTSHNPVNEVRLSDSIGGLSGPRLPTPTAP